MAVLVRKLMERTGWWTLQEKSISYIIYIVIKMFGSAFVNRISILGPSYSCVLLTQQQQKPQRIIHVGTATVHKHESDCVSYLKATTCDTLR